KTSGCSPLIVNFTDLSSGGTPTNWTWDFGNGNTSTGSDPSVNQNPSAIYNTPGTYSISLTVSDGNSSDVETKLAYITVFNDPQADFSASSVKGCYPFDVTFTDISVNGSGSINQWFWDFGDGNVSIAQSPANIYVSNGAFTVSLVVTDDKGCQNTIQKTDHIEVVEPPVAIFAGSPLLACDPPLNVNFTNASTGSSALTYEWSFGDTNTSTQTTPTNNYSSVGTYDVSLIVTDVLGCTDTSFQSSYIGIQQMDADFDFSISGCAPASVSFSDSSSPGPNNWQWDFGGGASPSTSTSQNPSGVIFSNPGTYSIELIATNPAGCTDTITKDITINPAPVSDFIANITSGCNLPMNVIFTESSTTASSFFWSFGDGSTSTLQNPTHTYTSPGTYNVILTVFNTNNCSDTKVRASYIEIVLPQANFLADTTSGCVPLDVNFSDQSTSSDPITSWAWDFGDGNTSSSQNPSTHTYNTADSFTVSLIIENSSGCRDTLSVDPKVIAGNKPTTDFSAQPLSTCADSSVTFTDETDFANEWLWDFGDGATSSEQSPTHIYTDTGTFNINLISYHNGCPDTLQKDSFIRINPPIAKFFAQQSCASPSLVNFINQSEGGDIYNWDFGDGDSSNQENPSHNYLDTGRYTVSLNVVDTLSGCEYTSYRYVDILALGGSIIADTLSGCAPLSVSFNSGSQDAISWAWDFGDGQSSSLDTPQITYTDPGIYTIELIITDLNGCKDTLINTNYIQASGPIVDFSANQTSGCASMNVNFTDLTTSPAGFVSWAWSFGDGDSASVQSSSNLYPNVTGSYNVSLEVVDTLGCVGTLEKPNYIYQQKPTANFLPIPNPVEICPGDVVTFINGSSGSGLTYLWDFGDGNTSNGINASNTYDSSGLYTVSLIVTDNCGCKDTMIDNMQSGSVIYDLAAAQGGNTAFTEVNKIVDKNGVKIMGETNILNKLPVSASNLYAKNIFN
ncbi:MAG TPA: PKD domain-containing protein, partial [Bacteroidetes bacterium]|nr:PKD domain-containing protein [Bacteroidota bacterium]